jgi:hypothetical protein
MNRIKVMCSLAAVLALAAGANAATKKSAGGSKTLTGCLQKGAEADTFMLTNVSGGPAADNKDWELVHAPAALKMSDHVGHKVSVTGSVMGAGAAMKMEHKTTTTTGTPNAATDTKVETKTTMKEESMERHLMVRSMKHIAGTCP